jgi:NADH-quinone oxidoreductase subunit M
MGFIFLGIASLNLIGVTGAVVIMIAHGFLAALTFGLSGYIYRQTGTLEMDELGGLARKLPFIGTALLMAALAGCGLPGFANFVGEVTVFFGAWKVFPVVTGLAIWGALMIGAIYMLRAMRNVLHGPLPEKWSGISDATNVWRKLPYALLLASLLVFGCFPRLLTEKITPDAEKIVKLVRGETVAVGSTRVSRVQFGVPPNCVGVRTIGFDQRKYGELRPQTVSGVTPETTRGTRVPPTVSVRALANITILN